MKTKLIGLAAIILLALGVVSAKADGLLEVRGGAGVNGTSLDDLSDQEGGINFDNSENYNLDLFLNFPGPFGVGLRNEWLNTKGSNGGVNGEIDATNLTLLVDFRILDNWVYLGPIAGNGYPSGEITGFGGSTTDLDSSNPTYTLAAEAGFKLGRVIVGGELGYTNLRLETGDGSTSVDLSGMYGKIMAGIALF